MRSVVMILCVVLSPLLCADDLVQEDVACHRPVKVRSLSDLENLYYSLADLALEDQREQMWSLSSSTKTALWTYNAERYLRNHPELTIDQQETLRHGIALINTPAWFDIQERSIGYAAKRQAIAELKHEIENTLPRDVVYEVLIRLGPDPDALPTQETPRPGNHHRIVPEVSIFNCSCGSYYDCSAGSPYGCYEAWCIRTPYHCGFYGDEACWGKCKLSE
jgi:hypothetical protein